MLVGSASAETGRIQGELCLSLDVVVEALRRLFTSAGNSATVSKSPRCSSRGNVEARIFVFTFEPPRTHTSGWLLEQVGIYSFKGLLLEWEENRGDIGGEAGIFSSR